MAGRSQRRLGDRPCRYRQSPSFKPHVPQLHYQHSLPPSYLAEATTELLCILALSCTPTSLLILLTTHLTQSQPVLVHSSTKGSLTPTTAPVWANRKSTLPPPTSRLPFVCSMATPRRPLHCWPRHGSHMKTVVTELGASSLLSPKSSQ